MKHSHAQRAHKGLKRLISPARENGSRMAQFPNWGHNRDIGDIRLQTGSPNGIGPQMGHLGQCETRHKPGKPASHRKMLDMQPFYFPGLGRQGLPKRNRTQSGQSRQDRAYCAISQRGSKRAIGAFMRHLSDIWDTTPAPASRPSSVCSVASVVNPLFFPLRRSFIR